MGKLFNSINKGFSRIFRVLLFVLSAFLIIYFFPKSGKFKYNFENGRPWQSENLYAPFDFAIKKSKEEIDDEITQAKINTPLFFEIDTSLITNSNNLLITRIDELKNGGMLMIGDKNTLLTGGRPDNPVLLMEEEKWKDFLKNAPEKTSIVNIINDYKQLVDGENKNQVPTFSIMDSKNSDIYDIIVNYVNKGFNNVSFVMNLAWDSYNTFLSNY